MNRIEKQKSYAKMSDSDFKKNEYLFDSFKESKQKYGDEFDFDKWADGVGNLSKHTRECLRTVNPLTTSFEGFANALGKTTKSGTQFGSAIKGVVTGSLKGLGKTLLGTGLNMLINGGVGFLIEKGISLAVKAYDKLAREQEDTIQKSKESAKAIADNYASIQSGKQWKKANAERFTELAQGIGKQGENLSLTSSEFEEYQGLASELSDIMPSLVSGFNSLGQPILTAAGNMSALNAAFRAEEIKKYNENIRKTSDVLKGFKTQYDEKGTIFKESGLKQKVAAYKDILAKYKQVEKENVQNDTEWGNYKLDDDLVIGNDYKKSGYNIHALYDIAKQLGIKKEEFYENIELIEEGYQDALMEMENVANSVKDALPSFFNVKDSYNKLINTKGNENIDGFMRSVMSQLDNEFVLNNLKDTGDIKSWSNSIINDLEKSGVQEAISKLYEIDSKKSSMNFKDYSNQVNKFIHKIDKDVKNLDFNQIMEGFDLGDGLKDLEADFKKVSGISEDLANTLSNSDLELAGRLISEQDITNAEQLKDALILAKQAAFDINANPIFDSVAKAKESKNAGADYVQAKTYLDETKELYDKGLTGTDEFKAFAKYLSPTGAEDEVNFLENYTKAAKYLTEDSTGVVNFLNDLSTKTDEAGNSLATFDKSTGKWSYNISDLAKGAEQMGMGFEFFMDMFGRLEDYGFSNNFFSTQEEGLKKITDKTIKLAQAEAELAELQSEGQYTTVDENGETHKTKGNQTAIDAKKKEIEGYKSDLEQLESTLDQVIEKQVQAANARVETARQSFDILKQKRDEILASNEFGDNTAAVIEQIDEQLRAYAAEGGLELDASLNIVNTEEITEQAQKIIEDAKTSVEKVQNLVTSNGSGVTINLDSDNIADVEAQMVSIMDSVESLKDKSGTIPIDTPGAEDAMNVLSALVIRRQELIKPIVMGIDTSQLNSDVSTVITAVQEFQTAYNELQRLNTLQSAGFQVNSQEIDNAKAKVDEALNKVRELDNEEATADIKAKLQIDDTSAGALVSSINGITAGMIESVNVPVDATVKGKEDVDALNDSISKVKSKSVSITASVSDTTKVNNLANAINNLPTNKNIYVTTHYSSKNGEASGTMLSPARANGTAYNTLNMSSAYAGGSVALPKNEEALVNEVGVESIVRDGVWSLLPGGAHIEQLKKGDIIFNASQTEQLLKYGGIAGHGKAYADGTVGNVRSLVSTSLNAYASGTRIGSGGGHGSSSTLDRGQSSGSKPKKNKSDNKIAKNTAATAEAAKQIAEELSNYEDWVERRFKAIETEYSHIEALFERMTELPDRLDKSYQLLAKNKEYLTTAKDAKSVYQEHLNTIQNRGLSQDIIDKIIHGKLELSKYDEGTQKLISEYESYYQKLRDCSSKYDELIAKQAELAQSTLESISDYYEMLNNVDEASKGVLESQRELWENQGLNVTAKEQYDSVNNSITEQQKISDRLSSQVSDYANQIEKLISSGYMERNSKEHFAALETLNGMKQELYESQISLIEFQDKLNELTYTGIQNLIDSFAQAVEKIDAKISYIESKDEKVSESLYQEQINANNSQIREKMKLKAKKEQEQAFYDVGSVRYQELAEEINNLDKETYQLLTTNEELKDAIFELRFADLDKTIQGYQDLRGEIEDFRDLLDEDSFFDKNGLITDSGLANLALLQQGIASAKKEISDYRTGLDKLQESFDNGVISETEYNEKSKEYREGIRDSIKDVKGYEDSLKDLYMTQMSKEVEALNKVIEKRKEALRKKAEYYDYDKRLKSETKDVNLIKAQIAALEGTNNLSAQSELKRLKEQLKEAEDTLNETKRQHSLDMQEEGYDGLSADLEKMLEDTEYEITHNADKQQQVISSMLNNVVNMYESAYNKINSIIGNTGFVGSNDFNNNQNALGTQSGASSQKDQATQHQSQVKPSGTANSTVTSPIPNDDKFHQSVEQELDKKPNTTNRLVAELKLSTSSVSLEEGQSTKVTYSVRPNDAKDKSVSWKSSNGSVAGVSGGTIMALSPGSCTITATTLDGSGISASLTVNVKKKPEPPKPPQVTAPSTSGSGDGTPQIGDAVIYESGRYYYSSDGYRPTGNQMRGETVYIGHINKASWATKPYAIYRDKEFKRPLGWVSLDQLRGYKNGSKFIKEDGLAWTQEGSAGKSNSELIVRKSDGAIATVMHRGDGVIPNNLTENLFEWGAITPRDLIEKATKFNPAIPNIQSKRDVNIVNNYDSLIHVDGNVDNNVLSELKRYEKEFLNKSKDYTMNYFNSELRKGGFRK